MNQGYSKIIRILGEGRLKVNEPMTKHTTFKIGGPADLFYEAKNERDLIKAIKLAKESKTPFFILGNGSKLLVGDKGIRGLVIKVKNEKLQFKKTNKQVKVLVGAGVMLEDLINFAKKKLLSGFEFLVGIPGSVGGAIRGNAGAWQKGIGDQVIRVKVLTEDNKIEWIRKEDCRFTYRNSRFKSTKEIILEAELKGVERESKIIEKLVEDYKEKRKNQPSEASAGCIFINPKPYSAGEMIDVCGLRGKKIGKALISPKHANFIVNLGGAKASEVAELISLAKKKVKEKFGIDLKEEIVRIGEF